MRGRPIDRTVDVVTDIFDRGYKTRLEAQIPEVWADERVGLGNAKRCERTNARDHKQRKCVNERFPAGTHPEDLRREIVDAGAIPPPRLSPLPAKPA